MAACYAAIRMVQRRRKRRQYRLLRRFILRDFQDPLCCDVDVFRERYGFDQEAVWKIHDLVAPIMKGRAMSNPVIYKVLVSLHILRTGCFQSEFCDQELIPMPQPSKSRALDSFLEAMMEIHSSFIEFPSISEFTLMGPKFYGLSKIPNVLGVVKCFPVYLTVPGRKYKESITTYIVCDSDLNILDAYVHWPGDEHNSQVWMNCDLRENLKENAAYNQCFLLADESFPLEPWLLVPFEECQKAEELVFNDHLRRALDVGKQCCSMLQTRFKAIHPKSRPLYYSPSKVSKIVMACLILHNIGLKLNQELPEPLDCKEDSSRSFPYSDFELSIQENILKNQGMLVRDEIAKLLLSL